MPRKKTKSELEVAELKYRMFMEKRNEYNHKASGVMADMENLRQKKNSILDDLKDMRDEKAKMHDKIQGHKRRRDEFQKRAKELLELRRSKKGKISSSLEKQLFDMDSKIKNMEKKQETTFMSLQDEDELIDELRKHIKERGELEEYVEEQKEILQEVEDINLTVDELFKMANDEHEKIVKLFPKAKEINKKMAKEFTKVGAYLVEIKKKREVFTQLRKRADRYHERVKEMREKILIIRKSTKEDVRKARAVIKAHNIEVKKALEDEKKLRKKEDESLSLLKKKGKIELK